MKMTALILLFVQFSFLALANDDIDACLKAWGEHPFSKNPEFRELSAKVNVLGIGGGIIDKTKTAKPELVLIRPNVAVLSKMKVNLLNPNGWYCLRGKVTVLGKTEIRLACKAHLASSDGGTAVMGSNNDHGGVTVLGSSRIIREDCKDAQANSKGKTDKVEQEDTGEESDSSN